MKALRLILAILLTLLLIGCAYFAGTLLAPYFVGSALPTILLVCIGAFAVALTVTSYVLNLRFLIRMRGRSVMQTQQQVLSHHAEAQRDVEAVMKRFLREVRLGTAYLVFLPLLAIALSLVSGIAGESVTLFNLISAYILIGFFLRVMRRREKPTLQGELTRKDHPMLFAMLDRVTKRLQVPFPRRVVSDMQFNASVFALSDRDYALNLGVQLLYILNEAELEQLLLHELAHMRHRDVLRARSVGEFLSFILSNGEDDFISMISVLYEYPAQLLLYRYMLTEAATSSAKEARADEAVKTHGDPVSYASLLAKMAYFELFTEESDRYPQTLAFVPEQPRENNRCLMDAFVSAAKQRGEFWSQVIHRELPALVDSHPTFRQRWESLGSCPYTVAFPTHEDAFGSEMLRILHATDLEWIKMVTPNYGEIRRARYLEPLATVEKWEKTGTLGSMEEMTPILNAYMELNRYDDALKICDRLIESNIPETALAYAKFIKGNELLSRYDAAGIRYLDEAAAANHNFAENALNSIILFCRRMAMEEELGVYRARVLEQMQVNADTHDHAGVLKATDRLSTEELPEGRGEEILQFILTACEGQAREVYLVRKTVTEDFFTSAYVVRFCDGTEGELIERAMDRIFEHLDKAPYEWQYSLFLYENDPTEYERIRRRLPACRIYQKQES